jgi:hypothetical protein
MSLTNETWNCGLIHCNGNGHCTSSNGDACFCLDSYIDVKCAIDITKDYHSVYTIWCVVNSIVNGLTVIFLLWRIYRIIDWSVIRRRFHQSSSGGLSSPTAPTVELPLSGGWASQPLTTSLDARGGGGNKRPLSRSILMVPIWMIVVAILTLMCAVCRFCRSMDPYALSIQSRGQVYFGVWFAITFIPIVGCIILQRFIKVHASFDQRTRRWLPAINTFFIMICTAMATQATLLTACASARRHDTVDNVELGRYAAMLITALYVLTAILAFVITVGMTIWARTSLQLIATRCLQLPRHQWTAEQNSAIRMLHVTRGVQFIVALKAITVLTALAIRPSSSLLGSFFAREAVPGIDFAMFIAGGLVIHPSTLPLRRHHVQQQQNAQVHVQPSSPRGARLPVTEMIRPSSAAPHQPSTTPSPIIQQDLTPPPIVSATT